MLLAASAVFYFISFVAYYYALKNFPISKVSPIMTVGVVILVVLFGAVSGEKVTMIHAAGVTIGIVSIFFLMQ